MAKGAYRSHRVQTSGDAREEMIRERKLESILMPTSAAAINRNAEAFLASRGIQAGKPWGAMSIKGTVKLSKDKRQAESKSAPRINERVNEIAGPRWVKRQIVCDKVVSLKDIIHTQREADIKTARKTNDRTLS